MAHLGTLSIEGRRPRSLLLEAVLRAARITIHHAKDEGKGYHGQKGWVGLLSGSITEHTELPTANLPCRSRA